MPIYDDLVPFRRPATTAENVLPFQPTKTPRPVSPMQEPRVLPFKRPPVAPPPPTTTTTPVAGDASLAQFKRRMINTINQAQAMLRVCEKAESGDAMAQAEVQQLIKNIPSS